MQTKIYIYTHHFQDDIAKVSLEQFADKLPDYMLDRANRYKSKLSAINFLQGRLLLKQGLSDLHYHAMLDDLHISPNGKPSIAGVHFNISHSSTLAVCAFSSKGALGVDIEVPSAIHLPHLKSNFTKSEWSAIENDDAYPSHFYQLWCRKESIIKATDKTLADLHRIEVDSSSPKISIDNHDWHLENLFISGNSFGAICCQHPIRSIQQISFPI